MIQQPNLCWRWSQFVVAMIASFTNAPLSRSWIVSIKLIVGVLWIAGASVFAVAIFGGIGWLAVYVIGLPLGFLVVSFLSWMFCVLLAKRYFVFSTCARGRCAMAGDYFWYYAHPFAMIEIGEFLFQCRCGDFYMLRFESGKPKWSRVLDCAT